MIWVIYDSGAEVLIRTQQEKFEAEIVVRNRDIEAQSTFPSSYKKSAVILHTFLVPHHNREVPINSPQFVFPSAPLISTHYLRLKFDLKLYDH